MKVKMLIEHREGCHALAIVERGDWSHPWAYLESALTLSRSGTNHAHAGTRWRSVRCNDPRCSAKVIVPEDDLLQAVDDALRVSS